MGDYFVQSPIKLKCSQVDQNHWEIEYPSGLRRIIDDKEFKERFECSVTADSEFELINSKELNMIKSIGKYLNQFATW
jgi:hypothetical protein